MRFSRRYRNNLNNRGNLETLEARNLLAAEPVISEFLAANQTGLKDEDGDTSDWIEIYNPGDETVDLFGYSLTDDADDLTKWRLPHVDVAPGERLVVFASNKDREDPAQNLHTNFRLTSNGEYLALVGPDGSSIITEFGPTYPQQVPDVAYGLADQFETVTLSDGQSAAKYFVPSDNAIQDSWFTTEFSDAAWSSGTMPIGYDTGGVEPSTFASKVLQLGPIGYWQMEETGGTFAFNAGTAGDAGDGTYDSEPDSTLAGPDASVNAALHPGNSATLFDGRNDAVTTNLSLNNLGEFTMMGYAFPSVDAGRREALFGQNGTIELGFPTTEVLELNTPGGELTYDFTQPRDNWYHIAAIGDGAQLKLYIDGNLVASTDHVTETYGESDSKFNIGGGGIIRTSGDTFEGGIDEVALFDRALTEGELTQLLDPNFSETTSFSETISTDVLAGVKDNSSSLLMRIPFNVNDPSRLEDLSLDVQYDDGFVAYLNGSEIHRTNAPGEEDVTLGFDVTSVARRNDDAAIETQRIDISNARDALVAGENVLAVQALNFSADNPDLLFSAELISHVTRVDLTKIGYLTTPTPEKNNPITSPGIGPTINNVEHTPHVPQPEESILVTAEITETLASFSNAELVYRVMFEPESVIPLVDDGTSGDLVANDGVFSATIPGNIAEPGQMIRWYARATDSNGELGRAPTFEFRTTNNQSAEYYGTIVADDTTSELPILHWFVEDDRGASGRGGARASLFYNGEFYDNMFVRQRGGSTAGLRKTNYKFDFKGDTFRFDEQFPRVEEFNLNSTYTDKSQVRQAMAFEAYAMMGAPASVSFPMHVRQNDEFFGIFNFIEEPDEEMLARNGLDPDGALYKHYDQFLSASSSRKKTREYEDKSDLAEFIGQVRDLDGEDLANYLYDSVDIPTVLNYLVGTVLVHQNDNPHKNHFLYRDSNDTGEWFFIPWDNDLSWGSNWVGTSTSDVIYADVDFITFGPKPTHDLSLIQPSHPFVNTELHREWNNHWNRLMDALLRQPSIKEMYLRRLRTGMDEFLGAPGTTDSYYDQRFLEYQAALAQDDPADREKWPRTYGDQEQSAEEAIRIIREEYLAVRRVHLYETHSIDNVGNEVVLTTLLPEFTDASYFIPTNNDLGKSWTEHGFNDAAWEKGQTGIGFDTRDRLSEAIKTDVQNPGELAEGATSIFVRIPFNATGVSELEELTLKMKYDDGFIAYINGTEVNRSALRDDRDSFDSRATSNRTPLKFENFSIKLSDFPDLLNEGENTLALHVMNSSTTNSDMLVLPELVDGPVSNIIIAGIPHAQEGTPALTLDQTDFDAHPQSGNQDEEYVRINNPTEHAVDISGWQLTGGIEHTFKPGTVVTSGGSIFVSPDVKSFRARETGPSGNQGLFVQGNYSGHLSQFGDELNLVAADGTLLDTLTIPAAPSDVQTNLRVTEIHYNPAGFEDATEFIELQNVSSTTTLDLSGVTISQGPNLPFEFAEGTTLGPGGYVLAVNNLAAFTAAYPSVSQDLIAGEFSGGLANGGERIKLDDALGNTVVDFRFGDGDPWSARADGEGSSLTLNDPNTSRDLLDKWYSWSGSSIVGGTPGSAAAPVNTVVINEVVSNTGPQESDAIELFNPTSELIDISGYFLSDSSNNFQKYQIPAGTTLGSGEFLVVDESQFNPTPANPADNHFALNSGGDQVWLTLTDANSDTWIVDDVHFGATRSSESLGRFSHGPLVPTASITLGAENGLPREMPVMISEIHYHPAAPSAAALEADSEVNLGDLEFIELQNTSDAVVDLSNFRLRGGADYNFDAGQTLQPNETIVVVSFNPERADNASRLNAFKAEYGIGDDVTVVGGYGGQLGDSFDRVRLESRPTDPADGVSFVFEDGTLYDDQSPWPTNADGEGHSLNRVAGSLLGYDPNSWSAAAPTPGSVEVPSADFDEDGDTDAADIDLLCGAIRSGANETTFDLNGNGTVDFLDHNFMIFTVLGTDYGDSNLDGVFNSTDLVSAFQIAKYEDGIDNNAGWADGDWNCDGDFSSRDFVLAFQFEGFSEAAVAEVDFSDDIAAAIAESSNGNAVEVDEDGNQLRPEAPRKETELSSETLDMVFAEENALRENAKQDADRSTDFLNGIDEEDELA